MQSGRLIIFEGPDGAGKSTAARRVATELGADYVHLGPFPNVGGNLARLYVEAIMPAVLGHQDVVLDRCWLSEIPYGAVFRHGANRIGEISQRLLERLALRCRTSLVLMLPPKEAVLANFTRRKAEEYLELPEQLSKVYDWYAGDLQSAIACQTFDYTSQKFPGLLETKPHPLHWRTAGNFSASTLMVGENFAGHTNEDPLYQWPFGALSGGGCSRWLARQLQNGGISERSLCWINADELHSGTHVDWANTFPRVVALGAVADKKLDLLKIEHAHFHHPQAWKRFHSSEAYPLVSFLQETPA